MNPNRLMGAEGTPMRLLQRSAGAGLTVGWRGRAFEDCVKRIMGCFPGDCGNVRDLLWDV